jgi:nucleoside-diphosphate-sugar epimerase
MDTPHLLIIGLGYTGTAIARAARARGWHVTATSRTPEAVAAPACVEKVAFKAAGPAIGRATHLVMTAAPGEDGDPALGRFGAAIAASPGLRWVGYLSTTGVYGDRGGGWVFEDTEVAPGSARSRRRVEAEQGWAALADRMAVDLFRVAGIYGPGRSLFDGLRAGTARPVLKPGQVFGRIHRDDIARAVLAGADTAQAKGLRVLNLADDEPAEPSEVLREAARLLGTPAPPAIPFEQARAGMSPIALSFWAESRRVSSAATQRALGLRWLYPTYREGLAAILRDEVEQGGGNAGQ